MYAPTATERRQRIAGRRRRLMHGNNNAHGPQVPVSTFFAPLRTSIVPVRGTGSATFTRATTATVTDHEGIIRRVLSGEARFHGARRVYNLVAGKSDDWTNGSWVKFGTCTITGTNVINIPATNDRCYQAIAGAVVGDVYVCRIKLSGTAGQTVKIGVGDDGANTFATITLTATPTVYSVTRTIGTAGNVYFFIAYNDGSTTATTLTASEAQLEKVNGQSNQAPGEYVSVGVLAAPYHGANVDGVAYFATTNGNSVS